MYWENSKDSHNKLVSEAMSRDKFEYIMTHIHFSDNLNLDESDKSAKLRPIFDHLNKCFLKYASPEEYHSVDEAMVPYNKTLEEKGIYGTGTIRENRIVMSVLQDTQNMKKEKRGKFDYAKVQGRNIIFVKWNENNIVCFASTKGGIEPVNPVKRYSQKEKKFVYIDQPHLVKLYNKNMGGVDRSDQNIAQYRVQIRGKKWYFSLLSHCIDMAITNAWHIHKKRGNAMDQLAFRRSIAMTILEQNKKEYAFQKGRSRQMLELRYDRMDHLVVPQEKQTRCAQRHTKTTTRCRKCDIGVHVKCFVLYHTPECHRGIYA
nr:unnamed protein product [Callosobruchus chinensis]